MKLLNCNPMNEIIIKIAPIFLIFLSGNILKRIGIFKKEDADLFLKIVFYAAAPSLVIVSVSSLALEFAFIYLPVIAMLIILCTSVLARATGRKLGLERPTLGVFLVGSMIMNTHFILPFVIAVYGKDGMARYSLFDLGNALVVFTFVYYVACKYGTNGYDPKSISRKLFFSPLLWALMIGITLNAYNIRMPGVADDFFQLLGNMVTPLVMLALGIYFSLNIKHAAPAACVLLIRMFFGFILGLIFSQVFGLEGLTRTIVLLSSAAPVGYNTLTFSSLENLDKEFAAEIISLSILLGFVSTSIIMIFFS